MIFLYEKCDRPQGDFGYHNYHILNANELYTTKHKMPAKFKVDDQDFEYDGSKWKNLTLEDFKNQLKELMSKSEFDNHCIDNLAAAHDQLRMINI